MKTVEIEFPAGTKVYMMNGSKPALTRVRAAQYTNSLSRIGDKETESETLIYSTDLKPNLSLTANQIAETEEDLMRKVFGLNKAGRTGTPAEQKKSSKKTAEETQQ